MVQRATLILSLAIVVGVSRSGAENILGLRKTTEGEVLVDLSNADGIAGMQFSIRSRGGVRLEKYVVAGRGIGVGMAVHQYLENDSTLNVLLLAPHRSSLPPGEGAIGKITIAKRHHSTPKGTEVRITGTVICDADARELPVTVAASVVNFDEEIELSRTFTAVQNYPNPFNPATTISYELNVLSHVVLEVYDLAGRRIASLVDQSQPAGRYHYRWPAMSGEQSHLASGIYIARLRVGRNVAITKMILTK